MKISLAGALVTMLLAFAAGVAGIWVGARFLVPEPAQKSALHAMVHEELSLSAEQEDRLSVVEATFAQRRQTLETEMQKANAELAAAIRVSETAGPEVEAAVHHFHDAMGDLQAATIDHVFAMRAILTPEQREHFDEKISEALTSNAR